MGTVTRKAVLWPLRAFIFAVALFVSFALLLPALGGLVGLIAGGLICAAALATEIAISGKVTGEGFERTAARRAVLVDHLMTPSSKAGDRPTLIRGESTSQQIEQAEVVDAEVIDEERPRLEP